MKILITGANGSLGEYFTKFLSLKHKVFPLPKNLLDITNKIQCKNIIKDVKPDIVINTAALSNIDRCERDESAAYTINTIGSLNIACACNLMDIPIVQISCSSVYEGAKNNAYTEADDCSPINIYGKTKLSGERLIRTLCNKYFIIRTSWIFGGKNCFVKSVIKNKNIPIFMCSDEISCPTYIEDLCKVLEKIIESHNFGVYNCVNLGYTKKSSWVKTIFNNLSIEKDIIEIPSNIKLSEALRPKCTILDTSLLKKVFNVELPSWEESLYKYMNNSKFL